MVCLAKGGECRYNYRYYTPGLGDAKSWTTPVIDRSCPDRCPYKSLVCDNHGDHHKCVGAWVPYPQYNKFQGLFTWYCRTLDSINAKPKKKSLLEKLYLSLKLGGFRHER